MKIRNRLYISAAISIVLAIILVVTVVLSSNKVTQEMEKQKLAMDMNTAVLELDIVTHEYLLHREKRMEQQWFLRYKSMEEVLEEAVKNIRVPLSMLTSYTYLYDSFSQVTANSFEIRRLTQEGASQQEIDIALELEERLVAQLLITSHSIVADTSRLAEEAQAEVTEAQRVAANLTVILMIILAIAITTSSLIIARNISKPLTRLANYSRRVGEGEYTADIEIKGKDEVASVASDVKSMVGQLQKHREHLEELVEERTSDLEGKTIELEQANNELSVTNKELESFSYSVSHDLRAPLRSMDGFSQVLLEGYSDKLDEQGKDYLQRVRSAAQRMGMLIDDLLNLSRVTRSEMKDELVDLSSLVQSITAELQKSQPERQVEFITVPGMTANGDARLLRILLENLLGNAWKFTGKHAKARIEFGTTQVGGEQAFFVRDDGVGFDMTYADRLFGVFQRLHTADEFPGTGVGLATVQRIAYRHSGRAWAEGKVEKGATFYFTLG